MSVWCQRSLFFLIQSSHPWLPYSGLLRFAPIFSSLMVRAVSTLYTCCGWECHLTCHSLLVDMSLVLTLTSVILRAHRIWLSLPSRSHQYLEPSSSSFPSFSLFVSLLSPASLRMVTSYTTTVMRRCRQRAVHMDFSLFKLLFTSITF
jgi:hypothetical protein